MEQSEVKIISIFRRYGGGIVFHVTSKPGDIANDYYDYFADGGKSGDSYANLVYLEELCRKGYVVFTPEMIKLGDSEVKDEYYTITAKGLRVARISSSFFDKEKLNALHCQRRRRANETTGGVKNGFRQRFTNLDHRQLRIHRQ